MIHLLLDKKWLVRILLTGGVKDANKTAILIVCFPHARLQAIAMKMGSIRTRLGPAFPRRHTRDPITRHVVGVVGNVTRLEPAAVGREIEPYRMQGSYAIVAWDAVPSSALL